MTAHYMSAEPVARRRLKHDLLISSYDKQRLMHLLHSTDASSEVREELNDLTWEIQRAKEVRPLEVPTDVVTMNSSVRVTDLDASTIHVYTIVLPPDQNNEQGKISILAPLGKL